MLSNLFFILKMVNRFSVKNAFEESSDKNQFVEGIID